jgi:RimJ/RimL family protein N-acetyltransferase
MAQTKIKAATIRDLSYVAAHMRASDRAEIECQMNEWSAAQVALLSRRDFAYVCELDGNPESAFGCGQVRQGYWIAWSWGTRRSYRCLPSTIAFITQWLQPAVYDAGAHRVEARALASHVQARRFLERIGGKHRCDLPGYGKNGETFALYDWVRSEYVPVQHTADAGSDAGRSAAHAAA